MRVNKSGRRCVIETSNQDSKQEECAMKMNPAQIEQTLHKLNAEELNAEAIPAGHPMMTQLERLFGDHTYFSTPMASTSSNPSRRSRRTVGWVSW